MAENFESWVKANGKWLAIGAAGLLVVMAMSGGNDAQQPPNGGQQGGGTPYDQGDQPYSDGSSPYDSGQGGDTGVDMDKWREEQAADDERQRQRVDRIREVDRCTDPDTGEVTEVPSDIGCD